MADRSEKLDWAERWIGDSLGVLDAPGGAVAIEVDMSHAQALLERMRSSGIKATFNHLVVRAVALVLARNPELHLIVVGSRRVHPERVDIGLSVAATTASAPVMILEDAGRRRLPDLALEVIRRVPEVRTRQEKELAAMRRWGWMIPFRWLRRRLLRASCSSIAFRRKLVGTFQVTCLPADWVFPYSVTTAATLGVGLVRDRVVAIGGQPAVRPTIHLCCAIDHRAWDGMRTARFLQEIKSLIESNELDADLASPPEEQRIHAASA